jgi:hypothetical protein
MVSQVYRMRSKRIPEMVMGCLLTVAVFALGMLFTAKSGNGESVRIGSTWLTKDAAGFFTLVLVVVGAVQALMFFTQLRYMRLSMRDTADAAKAASDAAEAAKEQVKLGAAQIEITKIGIFDLERAYLDVQPMITTRFVSDPARVFFDQKLIP